MSAVCVENQPQEPPMDLMNILEQVREMEQKLQEIRRSNDRLAHLYISRMFMYEGGSVPEEVLERMKSENPKQYQQVSYAIATGLCPCSECVQVKAS